MSEQVSTEVRGRIVEKLRNGTLPRDRPRFLKPGNAADTKPEWRIGMGPAGQCSACDEPIKQGEAFEAFRNQSGGELRLHDRCGRAWEEERHRVRPS